jgi:superfamily II DNA or RNA helicase
MYKYSIVINNSFCSISPTLSKEVFHAIDNALSFALEDMWYCTTVQNGTWDGKVHLFNKWQKFPTGFLPEVMGILQQYNISNQTIRHNNISLPYAKPLSLPNIGITLWDHQKEALNKLASNNRGLIQIATGGGKTLVMALACSLIDTKIIVLTQKLDLLYQLRDYINDYIGIKPGIFGEGNYEKGQITVAMIPSLLEVIDAKKELKELPKEEIDKKTEKLLQNLKIKQEIYEDLIQNTKMVIVDECHRVAAKGTYKLIQRMNNAYWRYGFSATAYGYRTDKRDFLIKAAIGDVLYSIKPMELISKGLLTPVDITFVKYNHHKAKSFSQYTLFYEQRVATEPNRNYLVIQIAREMLKKGHKVLIAVERLTHGDILKDALQQLGYTAVFINGAEPGKVRKQYIEDFKNNKIDIIISTVINEGVDIPFLDCIINARAEASKIAWIQLIGRALRKFNGKEKAYIFDIYDHNIKWLEKHSKERVKYLLEEGYTYKIAPF